MVQLLWSFHRTLTLPHAAEALQGQALSFAPDRTVRDLGAHIEQLANSHGFGLRVAALVNPTRSRAAPPHEEVASHFEDGDHVMILGDISSSPYPMQAPPAPRTPESPVPVTIFTGFLGAGKTTVLNHLLAGQRDKKFAVIENEFGAVPIDNELLVNSSMGLAEQVVVMENGCMCCTVRGDLLGAFDAIRQQMQSGSPLDAVLVETTGMADPVPIVRTLRQTPDIAKYFQLDGTITLVDCKTILDRLGECGEHEQDQERHSQISFADKILLNKLDLVNDQEVAEVWNRIRSFNSSAPIVPSVKGILPASELTNIGAYDLGKIEEEERPEHGGHEGHEGHGHSHGHGHDDCHEDHGSGHGHECAGDDCDHHGGHGGHAGHGHEASRHNSQIGSFSIVRKGMEVEPLAFARWIRVIATLPKEKGRLYRSKGVLAASGRRRKLIFHAVADVTETSEGPEWGANEEKICKMVFIGKALARQEIEERFMQVLQPLKLNLRPPLAIPVPPASAFGLAQAGLLQRALLCLWSKDVLRFSQSSALFYDRCFSPEAHAAFQSAAADLPVEASKALQTPEDLWLHSLLPLRSIGTYAKAWKAAQLQLAMPSSVVHLFGEPLAFDTWQDVEAAGVMWLELSELDGTGCVNYVTEFKWRPETMQSFFSVASSSTSSGLVKFTVEDPSGDMELDDDLKFRVNLIPEQTEEEGAMKNLHRLSLQLVGGKTSSKIYQIFFHTVDPTYQVHINVPDHRQPIFPTNEVFHQWHPLMAGLRKRPRLRFLIRLKPMDSGPLDAMCGCCG